MDEEARNIKTSLASFHNIYVLDSWLMICIAWCKKKLLGPEYTREQLETNVYEQWLMTDLRDLEWPCLPSKLSSREDFTLNGNFFLQVMEVVDLSKPKLWQLQRIRNGRVLTKGTQQESADITIATRKRRLQLTLSDGVQEVEAIEHSPIPSLSINLFPGAKLWVLGPVIVKRGRLMLERHNVNFLGGDVLKLRVSNHPENVLARSLKLPENPRPGTIDEKVLYGEADKEDAIMMVCDEVNEPKPFRKNHLPAKRSYQTSILARRDMNQPPCKKTKTAAHFFVDEDVDKVDRLVTSKLLEKGIDCGNFKMKATLKFTVEKRMTADDDKLINRIVESTNYFFDKLDQFVKFAPQNVDDDVFNDIDTLLDNMEIHKSQDQKPPSLEKLSDRKCLSTKKPPIFTLSKLLEMSAGYFECKVTFKSIIEKLTIVQDQYRLIIQIEDDTTDLIIKLHSNIILSYTGYVPADMLALKGSSTLKQDKSAAINTFMKAMHNVKENLLKLHNTIVIIQKRVGEMPVIVKIKS